jgi:Aldo/keto reductase family
LHRLEGECEVTDDWMMEALDAGVVEPDVVGGPAGAEGLALRRQLADEIREATVVRVAPGFGAQDRDGVGRNLLPVGVEVGRARGITEDTTFDSTDFRNIVPRFTPEAREANQALVDLLAEIAARKEATPAQIAIAWLLAQKPWIVPIPGTTKLHRLDENIGAAALELTPHDLREIESAVSKVAVQGDRYPERLEQLTGR